MHRFALVALLWLAAMALSPPDAVAATPEPRRHGPSCTPAGCAGAGGSAEGRAAGFAVASLASILVARRRGRRSR